MADESDCRPVEDLTTAVREDRRERKRGRKGEKYREKTKPTREQYIPELEATHITTHSQCYGTHTHRSH